LIIALNKNPTTGRDDPVAACSASGGKHPQTKSVTIPLPLAPEWQGYPQDLLKWTSCIDWRSASGGEARQGAMVDNWRREDRWSSHDMTRESAHRHPLLGVL